MKNLLNLYDRSKHINLVTEILSGLEEGDEIVTGLSLSSGATAQTTNPFAGNSGFRR